MFSVSKNLSTILSMILCVALMLCVFVTFFAGWRLWNDSGFGDYMEKNGKNAILAVGSIALVIALAALVILFLLLLTVRKGEVFTAKSISLIRMVSWICALETAVFLVGMKWLFVCMFPAVLMLFLCLVLRVVKNVIEEAAAIKAENDFTV